MLQEDNSTTSVVRMLWRPQPYKHIRVGNAFGNQWIGIHSPEVHSRRRNPMLDIKATHKEDIAHMVHVILMPAMLFDGSSTVEYCVSIQKGRVECVAVTIYDRTVWARLDNRYKY